MPTPLRSRLRRFAEERNLGETEALRLALSERLDDVDDERELAAAERWQFEQAYKTWKEDRRTGGRQRVPWSSIERTYQRALAELQRPERRRK
jgi:hypothetical protein